MLSLNKNKPRRLTVFLIVLLMLVPVLSNQGLLYATAQTEPHKPSDSELKEIVRSTGIGEKAKENAMSVPLDPGVKNAIFGFVYAVIGVLGILLLVFSYQKVLKGEPQHQDALWKTISGLIASILMLSILNAIFNANPLEADFSFIK